MKMAFYNMENGVSNTGNTNTNTNNYYACLSSSPKSSGRRSPAELENNLSSDTSILYNIPKITSYKDITKINTTPIKVEKKRVNLIPVLKRVKQQKHTLIEINENDYDNSDEREDIYHSSDDEYNDSYNNDTAYNSNYESSFISQENYSNNYYSRTYKNYDKNYTSINIY